MSLRILVVHSNADYLVGLRRPLLRDLVQRGYEVVVAAPNVERNHILSLGQDGIECCRISLEATGLNPFRDTWSVLTMSLQFRRIGPDLVLTNTIKPVVFGTIAAALAGVKRRYALISGLGYLYTDQVREPSLKWRILRILATGLYRIAFRLSRKVIFQNKDDLALMAGARDLSRFVVVDGSGVDVDYFVPGPEPSGSISFVTVARVLREKGVLEYLQAAELVKEEFPTVQFTLVGDLDKNPGSLPEEVVEAYVSKGVVQWIRGLKGAHAIRQKLWESSVFVLASYREGVPMSTLEAMACGLPVITTFAPGCRETVRAGVNGYLVPVRSVLNLACAMKGMVLDESRRLAMGVESRRLAVEVFSSSIVNAQMRKHLELDS